MPKHVRQRNRHRIDINQIGNLHDMIMMMTGYACMHAWCDHFVSGKSFIISVLLLASTDSSLCCQLAFSSMVGLFILETMSHRTASFLIIINLRHHTFSSCSIYLPKMVQRIIQRIVHFFFHFHTQSHNTCITHFHLSTFCSQNIKKG